MAMPATLQYEARDDGSLLFAGGFDWDDDLSGILYRWTASGSGTDEYYCELVAGGDPSLDSPGSVYLDGKGNLATTGTAGSLAVSEWDYADNDTLGFSTVYVRLADGTDPDTHGSGRVKKGKGIGVDRTQIDGATIGNANDLACSDHTGPSYTATSTLLTFEANDVGKKLTVEGTGAAAHFVLGIYEINGFTDANTITLTADPTDGTDETGGDCRKGAHKTCSDLAALLASDTTLTSTTPFFESIDDGSVINIPSGTNFIAGRYTITAVASSTSVTVDRACVSGGNGTSGVGHLGGAATLGGNPDAFLEQMVAGQKLHVGPGTHTLTGAVNVANDGTAGIPIFIKSYNATRGDNPTGTDRPFINGGSNGFMLDNFWQVSNIRSTGTASNILKADINSKFINCKSENTSGTAGRVAFQCNSSPGAHFVECEGISTNGIGFRPASQSSLITCNAHDGDVGVDLAATLGVSILDSTVESNATGIDATSGNNVVMFGNTLYNNATGIAATTEHSCTFLNNIFKDNTDAVKWNNSGNVVESNHFDYNCWHGNTRDMSFDDGTTEDNALKGDNAVNADPDFVSAATGDFTLNAGSPCIATGLGPGTNIGLVGTYPVNIGVDPDDHVAGGGGGSCYVIGG